jgi:hypothetical protein
MKKARQVSPPGRVQKRRLSVRYWRPLSARHARHQSHAHCASRPLATFEPLGMSSMHKAWAIVTPHCRMTF